MALQTLSPEVATQRRDIILLYGDAGSGKTRLATSLTERFGEIIYFALDEGSEGLDSVLEKYRGRIHVVKPTWENPFVDAAEIASRDWRKQFPTAKTIVIDTFSNLTWKLLSYCTNMGMFSSKHVEIGTGTALRASLPDRGDYGGTHAIIRNFVVQILNQQKTFNIVFVCHQDHPDTDDAGNRLPGGPATVGKAMTTWLAARFKSVIRLDREIENKIVAGKVEIITKIVARTAPHGSFIARINEAGEKGNPIPVVPVAVDARNFWEMFDRHFYQEEAKEVVVEPTA
jgi:hypothetical protein